MNIVFEWGAPDNRQTYASWIATDVPRVGEHVTIDGVSIGYVTDVLWDYKTKTDACSVVVRVR